VPGLETFFPTLAHFAATCGVLLLAETVYVLFGFGAGMIALGCLALFMPDLRDVVVMLLLVNLPAEVWVVTTTWRRIRWPSVLPIGLGILVGVPLGTWVLRWGEPTFLLVLLGAVLVVAGGAFLLAPRRRTVSWPWWSAPPVGVASGFLSGTFGTGGPPLVLYYQLGGLPKSAFRASLMAIFLLVAIERFGLYSAKGLITLPRLWSSLLVMPAVVAGAWLGNHVHLQLEEHTFRRLVSAVLVVIGVLLLAKRFT